MQQHTDLLNEREGDIYDVSKTKPLIIMDDDVDDSESFETLVE